MEKLIITVATTGAITSKDSNPNLPLTPEEIADEVYSSYLAGASIAHVHIRDEQGKPSMDPGIFAKTVKLIRERCDIILNLTSSGGRGLVLTDEDRFIHMQQLKPSLGSFDAGSLNLGDRPFINTPQFLEKLAKAMLECGVKPEVEVFEAGMITNALRIAQKGLIKEPLHFQFVLGAQGAMDATANNLIFLMNSIPPGSTWSVAGIGRKQLPLAVIAIVSGGHVRVGMEDNIFYRKNVLAQSNAQFVERIVRLAEELERPVANVAEARRILGLIN